MIKDTAGLDPKAAISLIVSDYKKLFPHEYHIVCRAITAKKKLTANEYAQVQGSNDAEARAIFEIPETLNGMLISTLSEEQLKWFKEGGPTRKAGARWFAKTFPEFALPQRL